MHGTFPREIPKSRSKTNFRLPSAGLAFAAMPILVAVVVALLRFGSGITIADILQLLADAAAAAPL
ncbi:MAG: hypothetical protein JO255_14595 [Alphaproteobacteria bacterium]|nr:hypothetical protein [Alphaproteobacteria bacterium]